MNSKRPFIRPQVGAIETYKGSKLLARFCGPDLLAYVDDIELAGFYLTPEAARAAGRRHVDAERKAAKQESK